MIQTADLFYLFLCFIFSACFSGSEAVLMSIGVNRIKQLIEEGGPKGKALEFMANKPNELLTTILIGNTIVNIYAGSLSTSMAESVFKDDGVAIAVGVTTLIILIFGELIPKTFFRAQAENLAVPVIRFL